MLWCVEPCYGSPQSCVCGFPCVAVAVFFQVLCEGGKATAMPHKRQFSPCLFFFSTSFFFLLRQTYRKLFLFVAAASLVHNGYR